MHVFHGRLAFVILFSVTNLLVVMIEAQIASSKVCSKIVSQSKLVSNIATKQITQTCRNSKIDTCRITKMVTYRVTKILQSKRTVKQCCSGYKLVGIKCVPICTNHCENGVCTQPNFCSCYPNYKKISENRCAPICNNCYHGTCIFPNACQCFDKYERHGNGSCVPICKKSCINADCTAPDTCSCHEGYLLNPQYSNICTPICNLPCGIGGVCHEPDVCLCSKNYRLNETNQCEPVCHTCANGVCTEPGVCVCPENYRLVNIVVNASSLETRCEPILTTIETTVTFDDYDFTTPSSSSSFVYFDDYETTADFGDTSTNADLYLTSTTADNITAETTPEVILVNQISKNQCDKICINGACEDGDCHCDDGYYASELIPNLCDPICEYDSPDGCINGTCIAPNTCKCLDGYVSTTDNNVCVPIATSQNQSTLDEHNIGFKPLIRQLFYYFFGIVFVLALATIATFAIYVWYNKKINYHLHRTENDGYEL